MHKKEWQQYSLVLKELLDLKFSPVSVSLIKGPIAKGATKKVRICQAILDAGKGEGIQLGRGNNACFGAIWHLGFHKIKGQRLKDMTRRFVVESEKLFCTHEAFDKLISQMPEPPDNSDAHFKLVPLEEALDKPQLVIFIGNAEVACRLLALVTFIDGKMPQIKIGGPTCRLSITYPLASGEVNISFYDYTSRTLSGIGKDTLIVSIPYAMIPKIIASIDSCSAGKAKVASPREFRQLLRKREAPKPL